MHAVVLLKQILDWELPASRFAVDAEARRPAPGIGPVLLGPFEQNALELALQLRDGGVVDRITAIMLERGESVDALRKALALRCDEAIQIAASGVDDADPSQTAELLVAAIRRLDGPQLVLAGRQAGDWDHGQVGYLVAERLGWPVVAMVVDARGDGDRLVVRRAAATGFERLAVRPPAVLTVNSAPELVLRMGNVMDRMAANRKPIARLTEEELGITSDQLQQARRLELERLWAPEVQRQCELIGGEDPAEVAGRVLSRLEELKVLPQP